MEKYQVTAVLLVSLVIGSSMAVFHTCIHDKVAVDIIPTVQLLAQQQQQNTTEFRNIRIVPQIAPDLDPRLTGLVAFPSGALARALQTITGALLVRPIQSNFTIPYPCDQWTSGPNKGKCMPTRGGVATRCGPLPIPAKFVGSWETCVSANSMVCNRTQAQGNGASNTDFLLFVGSTIDFTCNSAPLVFSYAAPCAKDTWSRPAAGYINFCANKLFQQPPGILYDLILHELIHALGFSALRFQDFHDGNLNFYQPNVSVLFARQNVPALSSPKVLAVARSYFNCSSLSSVPLENNGASRSHWEARILNHEIMTAFLPADYTTLSNFTLAFFEDSGWYRVNYSYLSTISQFDLRWGQGLGCPFVTDSCNSSRTYPYLCNIIASQGCTFDRGAKGECRNDYAFFDGCPIVLASPNSTCLSSAESEASRFGINSICVQVNSTAQNCLPTSGTPGCYDRKVLTETSTGMIAFNLSVNGSDIVCSDGQVVKLDRVFVLCPSRSEILLRTTVTLPVATLPALRGVVIPSNKNASTNGTDSSVCGYPVSCTQYGGLKLVGGPTPYEGQLQICLNGTWMTVCSAGFSVEAAQVACRQMGFGSTGAILFYYYSLPQSSGLSIACKYTSCVGSEYNILDCSHSCQYIFSHYFGCSHYMVVGVKCQRPCIDNETRIVQADALSTVGAVQVCKNGVWGDLCAPTWGYKEASVVCKQNAYSPYGAIPGRVALSSITVPVPNYTAVLNCTDMSTKLSDCTSSVGLMQSPDCNSGVAWVNCFSNSNLQPAPCQDGSVRLRNSYLDSEGIVEICVNRAWGTVCGFGFGQADASVVCRQLGYYPVGTAKLYSSYGYGSGPILLSNLACNGFELSLLECNSSGLGITDGCNHYYDASVVCQTTPPPDNCTLGDVRLVGGNASIGEVQVCYGNMWGSVCYAGWDNRDAGVVCKQLGFTSGGQAKRSNFTIDRRVIAVMEMDCTGVEKVVAQCPESGISCNSGAASAVICNDPEPTTITCADGNVRLRNGAAANEGRVEICYNNQWGPVCDQAWNYRKAVVTCRQLGLVPYGATPYSNAYFGVGSGPLLMQVQGCTGTEDSLMSCSHTPLGSTPSCSLASEVGVRCLVQGSSCTEQSARLVNGDRNNTGRVEVCRYGLWGTVCDTDWNATMAAVACLQIGYPNGLGAIPRFNSIYGQGSGPVWIPRVSCSGDERSLFDCTSSLLDAQVCSHSHDAGVECPIPESNTNCTDGALRLMYGSTPLNGRLEICHGGLWGTVCSGHYSSADNWNSFTSTWSSNNSNVACKQLGYAPIRASWTTFFSNPTQATRGIFLSDVTCSGTETALQNCTHNLIGYHHCDHDHDVNLKCQAACIEPCSEGSVRLARGASNLTSGRVEMCDLGCWVPVCGDSGWNRAAATVTCRQLGLRPIGDGRLHSDFFIPSNWTYYVSKLFCIGQELSLSRCPYYLTPFCYSSQAGAQCTAQTASSTIFSSIAYSPSQNYAAVSSPANPTTIVSSPVVISSSILTPSVQSSPKVIPTAIVVQPSLGAISVEVSKLLQPTQLQAQTASSTIFSSMAYSPSQNSAAVSSPANPTTIVSSPVVISSSILTPSVQSSTKVIPTAILVQPSLGAISVQVSKLLQPTQLQGETQQAAKAHTVGIAVGIICAILFVVLVVLISVLALVIIRRKSTTVLSMKDLQHGDKEELKDPNDTIKESDH